MSKGSAPSDQTEGTAPTKPHYEVLTIMQFKTYTIKNVRTNQTKELKYSASVPGGAVLSLVREYYPGWVFIRA